MEKEGKKFKSCQFLTRAKKSEISTANLPEVAVFDRCFDFRQFWQK